MHIVTMTHALSHHLFHSHVGHHGEMLFEHVAGFLGVGVFIDLINFGEGLCMSHVECVEKVS